MVHHPSTYAELLKRKIIRHGVHCWLVNTGWIGGPYGVGKRISIGYTRAMLNAALTGALHDRPFVADPVFGFEVPRECPGVPDDVLSPSSSWPSAEAYTLKYRELASRFIENFRKYESAVPAEVLRVGPRLPELAR
jgi:phosphoenolpyruvate carboxykinase (ATP)